MSQHDFNIANASGAVVRADLNDALGAIATNNSGATEPATMFANQWWFDTANNLLKIRNAANTAWVTVALKSGNDWTPYFLGNPIDTYDATPDTDHSANGPVTSTLAAGATITVMDLVYLGSASKWLAADASSAATVSGQLAISLESKTDTQAMKVALPGTFVRDDTWAWTPGAVLYASETAAAIVATVPTGAGSVKRVVGVAVTADVIYFLPLLPTAPEELVIAASDETTAITSGTAKVTFRMPHALTVTEVRASLSTASSSGAPQVDINEGGVSILSTKLTIDANELTSTTAATPAVISDAALAEDASITIDIDSAGTGAKGLKVTILGHRS